MYILDLPSEIQFIIIYYIKQGNYLDLAPLAETCSYYKKLLSFNTNWNNTIKIIQPKNKGNLDYLIGSINQQKSINFKSLECQVLDLQLSRLTFNILNKSTHNLRVIQICLPFELHAQLYQTLACLSTQLTHLSIRDSACEYKVTTKAKACLLPLFGSQSTLQTLDIPTFPSHELCHHRIYYTFPQLQSLTIALGHPLPWDHFKYMFPNLIQLTLVLTHLDQWQTVKSLLYHTSFFPWFKRLSIVSREPLKQHVSKEELKSSLLRLEGLNRITAGWDIIALV
ncbi:hypothetical protein G6F66_006898 [Rhizopus arrhizus]|nr:hypothetical protein G6F38_011416 [Rhizopus arrhizus]KAG1160840.1 hypothetical protein G6F37_003614 [Rhizopus arrhizus]KAG1292516.1 hypothetical protein G6F66_006898 [Rhizopus arrhizus]